MKRKVLVCIAAFFLLMGAALLIVPRVSNYVGVQIAHHTVDEFINLKDNIVEGTRPTEQDKESYAENSRSETKTETVLYSVDIDRLYQDSVAYNEMLKTNQNHLLIDETSYLNPALNLSEYGIPTMAQLKRCAFFAFKEECKMKAFANSRDSPILMEVKQLQFTRGGKSMNILKKSISVFICVWLIVSSFLLVMPIGVVAAEANSANSFKGNVTVDLTTWYKNTPRFEITTVKSHLTILTSCVTQALMLPATAVRVQSSRI